MKQLIPFALALGLTSPLLLYAQKAVEVTSSITEVSLYTDAASVTRRALVNLSEGKTKIKLTKLSPYIDFKTITVKVPEGVSIERVNHTNNYLVKKEKSDEMEILAKKITELQAQQKSLSTSITIVNEEINFLNDNRMISGKNEAVPVQNLKDAAAYYGNRIKELRFKSLELTDQLTEVNKRIDETNMQLATLTGKPNTPSGEIEVELEVTTPKSNVSVEVSYLVRNASWFPRYDIKADALDKPINLVYKASIRQETKEDWKSVKLKLTNAQPGLSGVTPALKPYLLNYGLQPPRYGKLINLVQGTVTDTDGNPLPSVSILVTGTTIGTMASSDGKYSINLPADAKSLTFSFIGFQTQTLPVSSNMMNVVMEPNDARIEEVVVRGYGVKSDIAEQSLGVVAKKEASRPRIIAGSVSEQGVIDKPTNVEFEVTRPFSMISENKPQEVKLLTYEIPAEFKYYSVPKIDRAAYLWAYIPGWEMYNLLDGEANVYFENTYTGSTLIDTRTAMDTLKLTLGLDKTITIKRDKVKELTKKQLIGSSKEETLSWKITVKNNKKQAITIAVQDQIPVSVNEEIKVNVLESSGALINPENGEVNWLLTLPAGEYKELILSYSVRFPKNSNLYVE